MRKTYEELLHLLVDNETTLEYAAELIDEMLRDNQVSRVVVGGEVFYYLTADNIRVCNEAGIA